MFLIYSVFDHMELCRVYGELMSRGLWPVLLTLLSCAVSVSEKEGGGGGVINFMVFVIQLCSVFQLHENFEKSFMN